MNTLTKIIRYFFYHEASDELVARVHKRLSASTGEEEKEQALQTLWDEIGTPQLSSAQTRQALSDIEKRIGLVPEREKKSRPSIGFIPRWVRMVAIWFIPLLFLSTAYYMYRETKRIENTIAKISFVERYVPDGKREQITLPDSSKVWLNSGTLLVYPSAFLGDSREVYLSGEGYFDVTKSETKRFIVKTNALAVEVLGTKFNVTAYPEGEKITTTLEQGSVKVLLNQALQSANSFLLKPDEQLVYMQSTGQVEQLNVKAADFSDWKEGGLLFRNSSFKDILKSLERTYNIVATAETSAYDANRLTIHFNKNESLENAMMLIKEMIPGLEYRIDGNRLMIK